MAESDEIIDRIVAGVLKQLEIPSNGAVRASEPAAAPATKTAGTNAVEIRDGVVTGSLLEERGVISGPLVFGTKSVLTPSAIDFLATRKLEWRRADATDGAVIERGRWLVLVTVDAGGHGGPGSCVIWKERGERKGGRAC